MSEILTQQEIDALLRIGDSIKEDEDELTVEEMDVLGEIGNITMGTAATTMSVLLNKTVRITTPTVTLASLSEIGYEYPRPCVAVEVEYTEGLEGTNLLLIKDQDVKVITDLMLGGSGNVEEGDLNEMHLSAIAEAMNQMIGSGATSLASIIHHPVNISPPKPTIIDFHSGELNVSLDQNETLVKIVFQMEIEGLLQSHVMQVMTLPFAKKLVEKMYDFMKEDTSEPKQPETKKSQPVPLQEPKKDESMSQKVNEPKIEVKPVQFQSFDHEESNLKPGENLDIILDIPLQVTVELGRTKKELREILNLGVGSIIELDKMAGESVDILVNGKCIARGEVVVIDENFGVRVVDIISPSKRISKLK